MKSDACDAPNDSAAGSVFDPASHGWQPYPDEGFIGFVGPFWTRDTARGHSFGFLSAEKHRNLRGVTQGGMMMTFADRAMGITTEWLLRRTVVATVQLNYQFVDVARIGEFVTSDVTVSRATRTMAFVEGRFCAGERLVGVAQGIWKIRGDLDEI